MRPDDDGREPTRELRLEGVLLLVAGGVLLALLVGAFELGRRVERWNAPARAASSSTDPLGNLEREAADSTEKLTFFDTLSGGGKEAEPSRQAQSKPAAAVLPPAAVTPGPWFVQVVAAATVRRPRTSSARCAKSVTPSGSMPWPRVPPAASSRCAWAASPRKKRPTKAPNDCTRTGTAGPGSCASPASGTRDWGRVPVPVPSRWSAAPLCYFSSAACVGPNGS